jgi:hypothetical protein
MNSGNGMWFEMYHFFFLLECIKSMNWIQLKKKKKGCFAIKCKMTWWYAVVKEIKVEMDELSK